MICCCATSFAEVKHHSKKSPLSGRQRRLFVDADNYGSNLLAIAAEPKGAVAPMNDHFPVWDIEITLAIEKLV